MQTKVDSIDWDKIYYIYCIKLNRTEDEFWCSSLVKISKMIDMYADEQMIKKAALNGEYYESKYFNNREQQEQVTEITSMSQICI